MIKDYGEVIISEEKAMVRGFTFDGVSISQGENEAIQWVLRRLKEEGDMEFSNRYSKQNTYQAQRSGIK